MEKLYTILKDFTIKDAIFNEENDRQFLALKDLYEKINNKELFLPLVLSNSIVCYQLSSSWEKYWEEFSQEASKFNFATMDDIYFFFIDFLPKSTWNKRFLDTKISRLKKLRPFLDDLFFNQKYFYKNMALLQKKLADTMNQKLWDKTIVFWVKMYSYGSRIRFWNLIEFPKEIVIPIDSRLENMFEKFKWDFTWNIESFYSELAKKMNLAPLHLDWLIWTKYGEIMEK